MVTRKRREGVQLHICRILTLEMLLHVGGEFAAIKMHRVVEVDIDQRLGRSQNA